MKHREKPDMAFDVIGPSQVGEGWTFTDLAMFYADKHKIPRERATEILRKRFMGGGTKKRKT